MVGTPTETALANQHPVPQITSPSAEDDTIQRLLQTLFDRRRVVYSRTIPKGLRRLGEVVVLAIADLSRFPYLTPHRPHSTPDELSFTIARYVVATISSASRILPHKSTGELRSAAIRTQQQ